MEEYIINNMINLHNKIAHPLYYNGYISMDERVEIREYINTLEQALNEIRDYVENNSNYYATDTKEVCFVIEETKEQTFCSDILQIIDKALGGEK